jgi:lambda family phage portal protein
MVDYSTEDVPPGTLPEVPNDPGVALGNGTVVQLAPGEDVKSINPGRPNTAFDPFVTAILRQVGAALEIPMELLTKHFTASYSASRAALLEAWKLFKTQRTWVAEDFCQPVYEEFLTEAVARGRISAPGFLTDAKIRKAYCGSEWNGPAPGQIDPLKEVNAAVVRVQNCFSTRAKETAELTGSDFNANVRQRVKEEKMLRDGGLSFKPPVANSPPDPNDQNNNDSSAGGKSNGKVLEDQNPNDE